MLLQVSTAGNCKKLHCNGINRLEVTLTNSGCGMKVRLLDTCPKKTVALTRIRTNVLDLRVFMEVLDIQITQKHSCITNQHAY